MQTDPIVTHFTQTGRNGTKPRLDRTIKSKTNRSKMTRMTNSDHKQQYKAYNISKNWSITEKHKHSNPKGQVGGPNTFTNEENKT